MFNHTNLYSSIEKPSLPAMRVGTYIIQKYGLIGITRLLLGGVQHSACEIKE